MKKVITVMAALMLAGTMVRAAHAWEDPNAWWGGHFKYDRDATEHYAANELTLDTFGSYQAGERKFSHVLQENIRHGRWGGGVGLNYFFTREFGIGADVNMADNGGHFVDHIVGNVIFRWPFEPIGLAPYVFAGGGRGTDPAWEWLGHVGTGLEWRFNPTTGIFVDGRYVFADKTSDSSLIRAGMRFAF